MAQTVEKTQDQEILEKIIRARMDAEDDYFAGLVDVLRDIEKIVNASNDVVGQDANVKILAIDKDKYEHLNKIVDGNLFYW